MATDMATVVQQHRSFLAAQITLPVGGILNFSNQDDFTHEVYVETPGFTFESNEQEPGTIVAIKFPLNGRFTVRCHIHPKMHLDVDVH